MYYRSQQPHANYLRYHVLHKVVAKRIVNAHTAFAGNSLLSILLVESPQHEVVQIHPDVASPVVFIHSEEGVVFGQGAQSVLAPQLIGDEYDAALT